MILNKSKVCHIMLAWTKRVERESGRPLFCVVTRGTYSSNLKQVGPPAEVARSRLRVWVVFGAARDPVPFLGELFLYYQKGAGLEIDGGSMCMTTKRIHSSRTGGEKGKLSGRGELTGVKYPIFPEERLFQILRLKHTYGMLEERRSQPVFGCVRVSLLRKGR